MMVEIMLNVIYFQSWSFMEEFDYCTYNYNSLVWVV